MEIDYKFLSELTTAIVDTIGDKLKGIKSEYTIIGKEEEQAKDFRTGDLLWEDEENTIPKFRDKWGWVEKELNDEDRNKIFTALKLEKELFKIIGKVAS